MGLATPDTEEWAYVYPPHDVRTKHCALLARQAPPFCAETHQNSQNAQLSRTKSSRGTACRLEGSLVPIRCLNAQSPSSADTHQHIIIFCQHRACGNGCPRRTAHAGQSKQLVIRVGTGPNRAQCKWLASFPAEPVGEPIGAADRSLFPRKSPPCGSAPTRLGFIRARPCGRAGRATPFTGHFVRHDNRSERANWPRRLLPAPLATGRRII